MSEVAESKGYKLEVFRDPQAPQSAALSDRGAYERMIATAQTRARAACRMGDACCLNMTVTDFRAGQGATVEAECGNGECPNPALVGETAMNRVLNEGEKLEHTPLPPQS